MDKEPVLIVPSRPVEDRTTWTTCPACGRRVHPLTGICGCNDR